MRSRIREFRKRQGMTQHALAEAVGCQRSALSEWETGARRVPTVHLWPLARCLHVTVDDLYEYDKAMSTNGHTLVDHPQPDLPPPPTPRAAVHALPKRRRASRAPH